MYSCLQCGFETLSSSLTTCVNWVTDVIVIEKLNISLPKVALELTAIVGHICLHISKEKGSEALTSTC